ncbi:zinc finger protein 124-like [Plodia interpunctella]|uniref:zinc finger protein 124-like n=1 Tax=Plodia interpunctella TaxID=58824 RepID=UPI002368207C|nr:zinc finger protein 124-like [Plodia interpunctella]
MIHNTGAYGPNEAPINKGAPINMTHLNVPTIPHNLNNLSKIPQQSPHPTTGSYNLPNYPPYGYQSVNMSHQMPSYQNYHSNLLQSSYIGHQSSSSLVHTGWQNGMLPMNLNMQNQQPPNSISLQHFDKRHDSEYKNDDIFQKLPLNIPQIQSKSCPKEIPALTDMNYDQQESCNNNFKSTENLDLDVKHPDILEHDVTRRKTLENTIKMIENILVNTTKNREQELCRENTTKRASENETYENCTDNELKVNEQCNDPLALEQEDSDMEKDIKPNICNEKLTVSIKTESQSMEVDSVFLRDKNGVTRDVKDSVIVESDTSVMEAAEAIKVGATSNVVYECPHCKLLIQHPKRFLIHTKWHVFGLTRCKRVELARVKSERRIQLREERDRANSSQLTSEDIERGAAFSCKDCDKFFGSKSGLKNHRQRVHPTRSRQCKICKTPVLGWAALRAHVAGHTGDAGFQCADCPKRFKYAHSLAKHRDTHLEKIHGCDQCTKKFGSQALLKMHMKTHARALRGTTFRCTYCGKGFYEAWNLQVHERTHRNERPFLCEICNTAFGTNSSLKRHLKVSHSSSKPHECPTCHRCFMSAVILERHERRVHGDPEDFKFQCNQCTCRYLTSKDLQKHVYKVHPKSKRKRKSESDSE